MSQTTPILDLPLIQASQAQKHVTHNESLVALDALVQPVAQDRDRASPPALPAEGDVHVVATPATGDWLGRDGQLAHFSGGGWVFHAPRAGWRVQVLAEDIQLLFDGTGWAADTGAATRPTLGVNTTADATNRLAVAAPATLLTHDGGGHQVKVNKATPGDTGSLLFQTNWSGRAEMGCAGGDDWSIKVSGDGAAWSEAITIDGATGRVDMPSSHGTWTPAFQPGHMSGDLATATGLSVVYAYWWKVGPLVQLNFGLDFQGVPTTAFGQKSTFSVSNLPFPSRNGGGAVDQGAVSGFVYRSISGKEVSLIGGGVSAADRLYGFVFYTGNDEAGPADRFHVRASYMAQD